MHRQQSQEDVLRQQPPTSQSHFQHQGLRVKANEGGLCVYGFWILLVRDRFWWNLFFFSPRHVCVGMSVGLIWCWMCGRVVIIALEWGPLRGNIKKRTFLSQPRAMGALVLNLKSSFVEYKLFVSLVPSFLSLHNSHGGQLSWRIWEKVIYEGSNVGRPVNLSLFLN